MTNGTCAASGCGRPCGSRRPYCPGHTTRLRKTGSLGTMPIRTYTTAQGPCSVTDCPAKARLNGVCAKHYWRIKQHGDPDYVTPNTGQSNNNWHGDDITAQAAHMRVRKLRGPASQHPCVACAQPAQHWAYDHLDSDEKVDDERGPYSTRLEHYRPMCVPCHKRFDLDYLAIRKQAG